MQTASVAIRATKPFLQLNAGMNAYIDAIDNIIIGTFIIAASRNTSGGEKLRSLTESEAEAIVQAFALERRTARICDRLEQLNIVPTIHIVSF